MFQSSSQTIGDYVATTTWKLEPKTLAVFTDVNKLKERVLKLSKRTTSQLSERQKLGIKLFLESKDFNTKDLLDAFAKAK